MLLLLHLLCVSGPLGCPARGAEAPVMDRVLATISLPSAGSVHGFNFTMGLFITSVGPIERSTDRGGIGPSSLRRRPDPN